MLSKNTNSTIESWEQYSTNRSPIWLSQGFVLEIMCALFLSTWRDLYHHGVIEFDSPINPSVCSFLDSINWFKLVTAS